MEVQACELGKNINLKFEKYVKSEYKFERNIEDFYCLNVENKEVSIFYQPNIGYSYIQLFIRIRDGINVIF